MEKSLLGPTLASLVDSGAIAAPAVVRGDAKGTVVEATVEMDGTITYQGKTFNSPSVAAGHAITATTGFTTPGRSYASVNGWAFWRVADVTGQWRSLKEVRDEQTSRS